MPESPGSLAEALIRLQASIPRITKDDEAQVGTRTYRYANLASIHDAVFPLLAEHGLIWVCCPGVRDDGQFVLRYAITHAATQESITADYPLPASGSPQLIGSAITYARRYTLTAVLGIAPAEDDDDGAAAETAAKPSYEERVAAGRMSRAQMREHGQLERDVKSSPRKAERIHGPAPDNAEWETSSEDAPGTITEAQSNRLFAQFRRLNIAGREARLALSSSILDGIEIESSGNLSFAQAERLSRELEKRIKEGQ